MTNSVYHMIVQALTSSVSARAAETMLQAALKEKGLNAAEVTPEQMQGVLFGPLKTRLTAALPSARAEAELTALSKLLERQFPKAPTLFTDVGSFASWDDTLISPTNPAHDGNELGADDFEFDDPEFSTGLSLRTFDLTTEVGQEDLIKHLGRMQGVQGVLVSLSSGEVLRVKAMRDAKGLSAVIAATALLFQKRHLKLMSAQLGEQTVCMRPLGTYCIAVIAGPQVNIGRLLAELQQLGAAV
ncbi:roadblock/LC7 domain-containing protein [Deinococcus sp.]|uniref:roadblock/LC7 domain-containing protein n=1 Tax=Deinococcus sp. TaxID=47478 RepID=UPI0025B9AA9D|nr:roadblock/LC7 domain-containing protein [Deinococcus sp.]